LKRESEILILICTILACVGLIDVIVIGTDITRYFLILSQIIPSLLTDATIAAGATIIPSAMLIVGTYFVNRAHESRGGVLNIIAGLIAICTYIYYANSWEITFLTQIGAFGYIMLIPAPISGILAILISRNKKMRTNAAEKH
jgi:hypothetical protein